MDAHRTVPFDLRVGVGLAEDSDSGNPWGLVGDDTRSLRELWSGDCRTDEPDFARFLSELAAAAKGGSIRLSFPPFAEPDVSAPGRWNLDGDKAFAKTYPLSWNYLDPESPNRALKLFQRRLYLQRLAPHLAELPSGAHVLDLGGGIGRFAAAWLARGFTVTLADPNEQALALALGHLAETGGTYALRHLAAEDLSTLPADHFHAVTAMEVFCYLSRPEDGIAEAARVLRPGGVLMASVESAVGSLDPGRPHDQAAIAAALEHTQRSVEGDAWVRYFTPDSLRKAVEEQGLVVETIMGTHYLPDGPMHHLVDFSRLGDLAYEDAIIAFETLLESTERWKNTARAWVVIASKPR